MKRFLLGLLLFAGMMGIAYLATIGCWQLMASRQQKASLTDQLQLSGQQRQEVAVLEKQFMARKNSTCQVLCQKRAQLIPLFNQPQPDKVLISRLIEEIGQEQMALEKTVAEHFVAVGERLDTPQRERLFSMVSEQLRTACAMTACGATPGCELTGENKK